MCHPGAGPGRQVGSALLRWGRGRGWFRWVQRGSVHAYLTYILATLVWLLLWQRGR